MNQLTPDWSWNSFFSDIGLPGLTESNVGQPDFFKEMNQQLSSTPMADWKIYLRWHVIHAYAPVLTDAFVQENFNFYGKRLSGTAELQPRWKRCIRSPTTTSAKHLARCTSKNIFRRKPRLTRVRWSRTSSPRCAADIPTLQWMSPETKKAAIAKLEAFNIKIGYPDKWRDYSKLNIERGSYAVNIRHSGEFEEAREIAKINKPVDRNEWGMTPPTVNAYYNPDHERDRVSRRHLAAALLRPQGR